MKKYAIILVCILFTTTVFSQRFSGGLMIGVSGNQIDGDEQGGYKKPGFIGGAFVKAYFTENISLKIESYYIGKGAVLNNEYSDGTVLQVFKTDLHYIEMPFLFNIDVHPRIELAFGIAPSYLFKYKLTRQHLPVDENSYSFNSFDFQPMGQVDFYLTDHLSSSLRFSYSIMNIRRDDFYARNLNNNIGLVIRYKIR